MPLRASPINTVAHRFIALIVGPLFILGLLLSISSLAKYHDDKTRPTPLLVVELSTWTEPKKPQATRPATPQPQAEKQAKPKPKPAKKPIKPPEKPVAEKPTPVAQPQPTIEKTEAVVQDTPAAVEPQTKNPALPTPVPIFKLTQIPQFLHQETAHYPESMRSQGRQGKVKLAVLIDKTGQVRQVTITQSAGQFFDAAAKQAISASTFIPAEVEGKAVAVILHLPVEFSLL